MLSRSPAMERAVMYTSVDKACKERRGGANYENHVHQEQQAEFHTKEEGEYPPSPPPAEDFPLTPSRAEVYLKLLLLVAEFSLMMMKFFLSHT